MRRNYLFIGGIAALAVLAGAGYFSLQYYNRPEAVLMRLEKANGIEHVGAGTLRFTSPRYPFTLDVPAPLGVQRVKQGSASETDIFHPPETQATSTLSASTTPSFQIFITPYVNAVITPERLAKDIPNGDVRNTQEVMIGTGKQIRAVIFESSASGTGDTREVWFIHGGFLYEVTTQMSADGWLADILSTFQFTSALPDNAS